MTRPIALIFFTLLGASLAVIESLIDWGWEDYQLGQSLQAQDLSFSFRVLDRNQQEIYRNFDTENREWTSFDSLPQTLKTATILAEDKRFYRHPGIDLRGIARAAWINWRSGSVKQGGSTITQQIARKVFLSDQRSYERKLREAFIALGIESQYSKDEILTLYLNTAPYGPRINGVKVAAETYFQKPIADLTDAESLVLALLPKNPVKVLRKPHLSQWLGHCQKPNESKRCSPFYDLEYDFSRAESLLLAIALREDWNHEHALKVWQEMKQIELQHARSWVPDDFQHFRFYLENFLNERGLKASDFESGLVVHTTLDAEWQRQFYQQLRTESVTWPSRAWASNFAGLVLDHKTGGPLVWIGSRNFWDPKISGQVDLLQSRRQAGSTIKPFIYRAAIGRGFQPPTIFYDSQVSFQGTNRNIPNADLAFLGGMRMSQALAYSRNVPATKALLLAGGEAIVKEYLDTQFGFGIETAHPDHHFGWTLALGTATIKLTDLANGYASLGRGHYEPICPITKLTDFAGNRLKNPCGSRIKTSLDQVENFLISEILSDPNHRPPAWNQLLQPQKNWAIKTGTSSKRHQGILMPVDNLVVGYTPNTTILLWAGNTSGRALKPGALSLLTIGSSWKRLANKAMQLDPKTHADFVPPTLLQRIHGEYATTDYQPPSYEKLQRFLSRTPEHGLNVWGTLEHERNNENQ